MSFLQFLRGPVEDVMSKVGSQQQQAQGLMDQVKGYVPKVQSAWKGGDEKEFEADVARKLVPAMTELIAAIAGINLNLSKATNVMDSADSKVKSLANGLGDMFGKI